MNLAALIKNDELRLVTESVAAPDWGFTLGETWLIPAGVTAPDALVRNSAVVPLEQRTPYTKVFNPRGFAEASKPRPEAPPAAPQLTVGDICGRFRWTPEQFRLALSQCGFPKRSGWRTNASTIHGQHPIWGEGETVTDLWNAEAIDTWVGTIRSLGVGR